MDLSAQMPKCRWKHILITCVLVLFCLLTWAAYHDIDGIQYTGRMAFNKIIPTFEHSDPYEKGSRYERKSQESGLTTPQHALKVDSSVFGEQCKQTCSPDDIMCQTKTLGAWDVLLKSDKVRYKPVVPPGTFAFSWEKEYLSFPPLRDSKILPDLKLSTFTLLGEDDGEVTCDVGQRLTGRIDLRDGYGNPRKFGLDEVRAWMVETNDVRKATAQVTDLGNGSYALGVTCLWPGSISTLRVSVAYPREFIRSVVHQVNAGMSQYLTGTFKSQDFEETTACSYTPNVPGRDCACNFTDIQPFMTTRVIHENSRGMYCGRPIDPRLTCSHWVSFKLMGSPQPYNVTEQELQMIKAIPGYRGLKKEMAIITTNSGKMPPLKSCHNSSPEITWDVMSRPQGYWINNKWESLLCKQPAAFDKTSYDRCLRDSTVYIYGDSNAYRHFGQLSAKTGSHPTINGQWPSPAQYKNEQSKITIEFRKHDMVVRLNAGWRPRVPTDGSVESLLDAIPSSGRSFVILHYYIHMMHHHLSVARSRIQAAARGVSRLLQRNPEAYVAIRGPHITTYENNVNHADGGDTLGLKLQYIILQAFSGMKHRVLFLDGWDMTIPIQNKWYHPAGQVLDALSEKLLSFFCKF